MSFHQISRILELTDRLGWHRGQVEIPVTPESPGAVRKLPNGKLEIVVDAVEPFDHWLATLEDKLRAIT